MIESRRSRLPDTRGGENPGLLLNRYLPVLGDKSEAARGLSRTLADKPASEAYTTAFTRWEQTQTARHSFLTCEKLAAPLAVGLGSASPTEVGLTTSRPYGMPVIPGSALKGVCKTGATRMLADGLIKKDAFDTIFGTPESASYFVFWDAWYDPTSMDAKPFHPDTITVHHGDYYGKRGTGGVWPTDFDDPNPVPFLVVRPGAKFLFALDAPTPAWGAFAVNLLRWSLANVGVGGKTNAGYGYFAAREKKQEGTIVPVPATDTEWAGVTVQRNPGNGELFAASEGRRASVSGAGVQQILASLPPDAQERLRDKKIKRLDNVTIQVAPGGGNNFLITGIIVPPT